MLLVTPIVTSSAIAPFVLSIAASPSLAATLASSEAKFNIGNFSHIPFEIETFTDTGTFTNTTSGQATAEANAFAEFITNASPPFASNASFSTTNGNGSNYLGQAESEAAVIGYDFLVGKGEIFSFDFKGFLNLKTSIDKPQSEVASAAGDLSLELFNSTDQDNWVSLSSFILAGNLTTLGDGDSLGYDYDSANITFNPIIDTSFGGTQEFANASVQGNFSHTFNSLTSLTLVEVKSNQANVAAAVPEPSSTLATLGLCLAGLGYRFRSKVFGAKTKITY